MYMRKLEFGVHKLYRCSRHLTLFDLIYHCILYIFQEENQKLLIEAIRPYHNIEILLYFQKTFKFKSSSKNFSMLFFFWFLTIICISLVCESWLINRFKTNNIQQNQNHIPKSMLYMCIYVYIYTLKKCYKKKLKLILKSKHNWHFLACFIIEIYTYLQEQNHNFLMKQLDPTTT